MMKKMLGLAVTAMFLLVGVMSSFAETNTSQSSQQPTTAKIDTSKQAENKGSADNQQNSGSVYESIRSGWNKFIDLLAGPKQ